MSLSSSIAGWLGEKVTQLGMWATLDEKTYIRFHDVIIQTENGTTQIDHVLLSKYGIFVIETKNYDGWILGGEKQKNWTQIMFGKKNSFQNPLYQNYKHTKALSECLQVGEGVKDALQFHGPLCILVDFIKADEFSAKLVEFVGNFIERGAPYQEMISLQIERLAAVEVISIHAQ